MVEDSLGSVGLVLAGAVAQGGFEAGFLGGLAERHPGLQIRRIAGTSSGSLNAAVAAVGVATGQFAYAAEVLQTMWTKDASLLGIARVVPRAWLRLLNDWVHVRGFLETTRLRGLVEEAAARVMQKWDGKTRNEVTCTLVTSNLNGTGERRRGIPLPRFEQPVVFRTDDLVDPGRHQHLAEAAAASATFPILFSPTSFDGDPCIDGGAVNNAPIAYVLREPEVRRHADRSTRPDVKSVIVVTTEGSSVQKLKDPGGRDLVARIASALIDERIAHDLSDAVNSNRRHADLDALLTSLNVQEKDKVFQAAGCWPADLYLVQPQPPLPGNAFSGFLEPAQRQKDIAAGRLAQMIALR